MMKIKDIKLFAALLALICAAGSLDVHAQSQLAPARFVGVPAFTGNIATDPNWGTDSGIFGSYDYDPAIPGPTVHTNSGGTPSMLLMPLAVNHEVDLYDPAVANGSDTNGDPVPHQLIFWRKGTTNGGYQLTVTVNGYTLMPILQPGPTDWNEVVYLVPAMSGSTLTVKFAVLSTTTNSGGTYVDAVQFVPAILPSFASANDFAIVRAGSSVKVSWSMLLYSNFYLASSSNATGPYLPFTYTATTNNGVISTMFPSTPTNAFFVLKE